ncbi:diguanylate cyclase [Martelella mediterranea]|uniref:diguanylate cyclase n=1 Tax=Martelella mediterranea TaxID=293089 RepID=UPI001A9DC410|nr:diguanylate cyclase [Martelella mediterranea]
MLFNCSYFYVKYILKTILGLQNTSEIGGAFRRYTTLLQFSFIGQLVASLGLGALVVIGYGIVLRRLGGKRSALYASAIIFSFGALAAMVNPIELQPGIVFDARAVFIALAAPFGGSLAGVAAGMSAAAFRYWGGGDGAVAGMTGIVISTLAGLIFCWLSLKRQTVKSLLMLGLMTDIMVFSVFVLGFEVAGPLFQNVALPLSLINIGGVVMLGYVLEATRQADDHLRLVEFEAERDPLTNLWNRRALAELGVRMAAPDNTEPKQGCIILFDIDHFKAINDRFGHPRGDLVLLAVARVISTRVRRSDMVVRYGGEEIAVILLGSPVEAACRVAEQVRHLVEEERFEHEGHSFGVTVSAGLTAFDTMQMPLSHALDLADRALYKAKNAGRNRVHFETVQTKEPIAASNS